MKHRMNVPIEREPVILTTAHKLIIAGLLIVAGAGFAMLVVGITIHFAER